MTEMDADVDEGATFLQKLDSLLPPMALRVLMPTRR
jgi:hypothetical protein